MVAIGKAAVAERINAACKRRGLGERGRPAALLRLLKDKGLKVSVEAVRKWLAGETIPSMDSLRVLALVVNDDPDHLLTGRRAPAANPALAPVIRELQAEVQCLSEADAELLLTLAKRLVRVSQTHTDETGHV